MKTISLSKITIKNFRSFTDESFTFPQSVGLKLLGGNNLLEPRLGANGAGKSSLWDAVCWCLYGYSIKGARTSAVLSWKKEQVDVSLEVSIEGINQIISRSGPPAKILINNKVSTQDQIEILLGLSYKKFLHSIVFGQGISLFPDLSTPERGELLDGILNLEVWQRCSDAATAKNKSLTEEINKIKTEIAFIDGKLSSLQSEESIKILIADWQKSWQLELNKLEENQLSWNSNKDKQLNTKRGEEASWEVERRSKSEDLVKQQDGWKESILQSAETKYAQVQSLEVELAPLKFEADNPSPTNPLLKVIEESLKNQTTELNSITFKVHDLDRKIDDLRQAQKTLSQNTCPVCGQLITNKKRDEDLKISIEAILKSQDEKKVHESLAKELNVKVESQQKQVDEIKAANASSEERIRGFKREANRISAQIKVLSDEVSSSLDNLDNNPFTKQLENLQNELNPYTRIIHELEQEINPFIQKISEHGTKQNPFLSVLDITKAQRIEFQEKKNTLVETNAKVSEGIVASEYWKHGFKRIRLFFIQRVLSVLELEIQSAISALGLDGWKVTLATESETKSGSLKLGINIHISSPISEGSWDVWSGGETQRLRLAIAMGLGSLIQRAAGIFSEFEVWDEPSAWLSSEGIEDLLEALKYRSQKLKKQVWVVDHRALTYSGFSEIWNVQKDESGSKLYKLNEAE